MRAPWRSPWRLVGAAALLLAAGSAVGAPRRVEGPAGGESGSPAVLGETRFPHSLHAEELGFDCVECHHETAAARLETPHDEVLEELWPECRTCHRDSDSAAEPQACAGCHHASPVSTADETLSAKVVIHRSCWTCHESGSGEEASRSCGFCHAPRQARAEARP